MFIEIEVGKKKQMWWRIKKYQVGVEYDILRIKSIELNGLSGLRI